MKAMTGVARVSVSMDPPTLSDSFSAKDDWTRSARGVLMKAVLTRTPKAKALRRKTRLNDLILIHPEFAGM